jgi:C1A family cysteine protease
MKVSLGLERLPLLICFKVIPDDINKETGIISGKKLSNTSIGFHAICLTGWKTIDNELYFEFINSWGDLWGDKGYGYLNYRYFADHSLVPDIWSPSLSYF